MASARRGLPHHAAEQKVRASHVREQDGENERDYEVGRGKPPVHSRFKNGQSANARTAPEEPAGIAAPGDHQVRGGSKQLVNKSAGADPRATKMLIDGRAAVRPDRGESR